MGFWEFVDFFYHLVGPLYFYGLLFMIIVSIGYAGYWIYEKVKGRTK